MATLDIVTENYTPMSGTKHCKIFLIFMIVVSLSMLVTFVGALNEGLLKSKAVVMFAVGIQLLIYLITFYVYRVFYSMCMKTM